MINYISGNEYTGQNAIALAMAGYDEDDAFVTFKQAITLPGMTGAKMKGIKQAARLVRFNNNVLEENAEGKLAPKPIWFSVFDVKEILKRAAA